MSKPLDLADRVIGSARVNGYLLGALSKRIQEVCAPLPVLSELMNRRAPTVSELTDKRLYDDNILNYFQFTCELNALEFTFAQMFSEQLQAANRK